MLILSDDKSYAKIIAEPLEKGYGLTLRKFIKKNFIILNKRYSCNCNSN